MAQAFLTICCIKSNELKIMKSLDEIPEIIETDMLIGNFEIICKITAPTYNDISEIISKKIRKIPEIIETITINVVNTQGVSR